MVVEISLQEAFNWLLGWINKYGLALVFAYILHLGRRFEKLDRLSVDIRDLTTAFEKLRDKVGGVSEKLNFLEGKTSDLLGSASPLALKPKGVVILKESGLQDYINETFSDKLESIFKESSTAYDIQSLALETMSQHEFPKLVENKLKQVVFENGASMGAIRQVGAIYLRDLALDSMGFTVDDIDEK